MNKLHISILLLSIVSMGTYAQTPDKEDQVLAAKFAAPEEMREDATVYGYDANGQIILLKQGTNEIICLGDDPNASGFNAACYHKDLQPFMERGKELKKNGKSPKEIFDIREEEVKSNKLAMPKTPTTLYVMYGPNAHYDKATKSMVNEKHRYVIYIPFATSATSGLPTKPRFPGDPWLMNPGTHRAHIMVTPQSGN